MSRSADNDPQALLQAYMDDLLAAPGERPYADPVDQQRERLQKLLYSATPKPQSPPRITRPVVVEPKTADPKIAAPKIVEPKTVEPKIVEPAPFEQARTVARVTPAAPRATAEPKVKLAEPLPAVEHEPSRPARELADSVSEPEPSTFRMKDVEWRDNGRPVWAQDRFDVLLFKVSGLTLAVPLIALGQIQPLTDELTPLFGQADWFMGLQPTPAGKIRTVNTAKFVMPERYDERFVETAEYVISIDGVPWGLAVDSVNQPISLDPDDVKWRTERSRRPWLAGTVKEHMCALLDIPRIGQLLMEADRKRA